MGSGLAVFGGRIVTRGGLVTKTSVVVPVVGLRAPTEQEWIDEKDTWATQDAAGAFGSPLKLTMGGYRDNYSGLPDSVGSYGSYWSSTVNGTGSRNLSFISSVNVSTNQRSFGLSVRLILHDTYTLTQYQTNYEGKKIYIKGVEYGYCYNQTTQRIWLDRNLGASQVATSSTDANAYGDLFQWGRYSDGHEKRDSGTTWTKSSTDTPEHALFIRSNASPNDWRNPQNDSLWQGVNGINNPGLLAVWA